VRPRQQYLAGTTNLLCSVQNQRQYCSHSLLAKQRLVDAKMALHVYFGWCSKHLDVACLGIRYLLVRLITLCDSYHIAQSSNIWFFHCWTWFDSFRPFGIVSNKVRDWLKTLLLISIEFEYLIFFPVSRVNLYFLNVPRGKWLNNFGMQISLPSSQCQV